MKRILLSPLSGAVLIVLFIVLSGLFVADMVGELASDSFVTDSSACRDAFLYIGKPVAECTNDRVLVRFPVRNTGKIELAGIHFMAAGSSNESVYQQLGLKPGHSANYSLALDKSIGRIDTLTVTPVVGKRQKALCTEKGFIFTHEDMDVWC